MRLERAVVAGFGKLKELELRFSPNLTVIFGENASGKTTLQRFIVASIYGFPRRGRAKTHPEQALYRPWEGKGYRGSLLVSLSEGREMEVSRNFSEGTGEGRVKDLSSGEELSVEELSRKLGLDRRSFEAACVVRQMEIQEVRESHEAREALRSALEKLAGGPDATAREAMDRLEKVLREVGVEDRGRKTERGRAWHELEKMREELKRAEEVHQSLEGKLSRQAKVDDAFKEAERKASEARRNFLAAKERELEEKIEKLKGLEGELRQGEGELKKWEGFSTFPAEREKELDDALVRREEARRALEERKEEAEMAEGDWRRAREELEGLKAVEEALGSDPERAIADLERKREEALKEFERAEGAKGEAEVERREARSLLEKVKAKLKELSFVATLGPEPERRLDEVRVKWSTAKGIWEREKEEAESKRREIEELRRKASLLRERSSMLLLGGLFFFLLSLLGLIWGVLGPKWALPLAVLALLVIFLLAQWRLNFAQSEALEREAKRKEEELRGRVEEVERGFSEAEREARQFLQTLRLIQGEENVRGGHFERAREVIGRWREAIREVSTQEERLRKAEEEAGKACGQWEWAKSRFEEEEGRSKVVLEAIEALDKGEAVSPEAFERAWAKVRRWTKAKERERTAREHHEKAKRNLEEAEERLRRAEADVQRILEGAQVRSVEEFKERAKGRKEFDKWSINIQSLKGQIEALLSKRKREDLEAELERARKERKELESNFPELRERSFPKGRPEELGRVAEGAKEEVNKLSEERRRLEGEIEQLRRGPNLSEVRAQFEEAKEKYRQVKEFSEELQWAKETLEEAARQFGLKWAERLTEEVNPLVKRLLRGAYEEVRLFGDLSVSVRPKRQEGLMGPEVLSTGEREQLFLLLRACVAKELSRRGESLPLVLDEPFGQVDKGRRLDMWQFLLDLSREIQLVVFTCQREHFEEAVGAAQGKGLPVKVERAGEFEIALVGKGVF